MSNKPIVHAPIATGSTEPRDIRDRFADMPNVKDFGAVGDGTTDDTAAFTAAQNSGAPAVMVPRGTYNITQDVSGTFYSFGYVDIVGGGNVEIIDVLALDSVPIGTVLWLSTSSVPAGYLLCNGSAVGRATYPELFTAIGTTYGAGDGSTTFNLPNLIEKFAEGSTVAGTVKNAGLPNITGNTIVGAASDSAIVGYSNLIPTGAFDYFSGHPYAGLTGGTEYTLHVYSGDINASRSSAIYGNSNTVQPPSLTLLPCIKAFSSVVGNATVVAGQLVNDIQSKVALDGSNASTIGKTLSTYMAHAANIAYSHYIDVSLPFVAPEDGWMYFEGVSNFQNPDIQVYYTSGGSTGCAYRLNWDGASNTVSTVGIVPISKGIRVYMNVGSLEKIEFHYANGTA